MNQSNHYKPLWQIHNHVYRHYAKGIMRKRIVRYLNKIQKILKLRR